MDRPSRQREALDLCELALELAEAERGAFLDDACNGDALLRASVESLLEAADQSTDFLQPATLHPEVVELEETFGVYRIVAKLGAGGMGSVYRAERKDAEYTQQVAIKFVDVRVLTRELIARFNAERRILATLQHPYIANLIDGGTTDNGVPYLVMELVDGVPIDLYCDTNQLGINARLQLIEKVATAVQSAHQNLVVHRDLKPSNILITKDGIPKLLDFGIAKLLEPGTVGSTDNTVEFGQQALTPDFASPEQILEGVVTTSSDVYSLGVLTYRLMTGVQPYRLEPRTPRALFEAVESLTVPSASSRVTGPAATPKVKEIAAMLSTTPARLSRALAGDMDTILAKAMHMDPARRYPSAAAFRADLERFRKGQPVEARGDSTAYRLQKSIARHRYGFAAGAAVVVALVVGLGVSMWQAKIAERRFNDLHALADKVMFDIHDSVADLPGSTAARELIVKEALHYLDRLERDASRDPQLLRDLARAYQRVGDVQGYPYNSNLGDSAGALRSYEKGLEVSARLAPRALDYEAQRTAAVINQKVADVSAWRGEMDRALDASRVSNHVFLRLAMNSPDDADAALDAAVSLVKRGDLFGSPTHPNVGRKGEAKQFYLQALKIVESSAQRADSSVRARRQFALIHERLGQIEVSLGNLAGAIDHYNRSLALREILSAAEPNQYDIRRDYGVGFEKIADTQLEQGTADEALVNYRKALAIYEELAGADPDNMNAARTLAIGLENVGEALVLAGDTAGALSRLQRALGIHERLVAGDPDNQNVRGDRQRVVDRIAALAPAD